MRSLKQDYRALVIGASGGIGAAIAAQLRQDSRCGALETLSRRGDPGFDVTDEASVAEAVDRLGRAGSFDLVFDATGALTIDGTGPEKTIRTLDPAAMARQFAVNAIGPALLMKHVLPLLSRQERALFATLSARVGSIGDNRLGGWISYRASKAALNQIVRTAAIEARRTHPNAVVAALHPGTVATSLSEPYGARCNRLSPDQSAALLLEVLDQLERAQSGGFFAYDGSVIQW
ncbi:SDR family NAD(P)-dependent oxidoreductase [Rhizobium halophilum]|uniref:SDR family NAD(P)-dependent oxidoreductase n=1 Tax=Rhizobium halophilum TaxID=2846852 RepID=UPI001EFD8682|nr:SDR family NAD(P)-dependent oxidoreductase [Rhizobium halophilum]MCF6367540.1 SDR family NAD(P)-dependent oxidoreductase [Rhizobium halophilum]